MPSNHLVLCHPLLLLPSIFPSIRIFSKKSVLCIRWPKYWCFSFNISPSNEYSGLISFRMDWLDLLAVQETLKSLLQHHSSKASVLLYNILYKILFTKIKSALQYCICFCCTNSANLLQIYMYPLPPKPPFHPHLPPPPVHCRAPSWPPVICSSFPLASYLHTLAYICWCYSLNLLHALLPLLCPQIHSPCLCLYSCPANKFISTSLLYVSLFCVKSFSSFYFLFH